MARRWSAWWLIARWLRCGFRARRLRRSRRSAVMPRRRRMRRRLPVGLRLQVVLHSLPLRRNRRMRGRQWRRGSRRMGRSLQWRGSRRMRGSRRSRASRAGRRRPVRQRSRGSSYSPCMTMWRSSPTKQIGAPLSVVTVLMHTSSCAVVQESEWHSAIRSVRHVSRSRCLRCPGRRRSSCWRWRLHRSRRMMTRTW